MMEEIWKDVKGFEGRYQVSNLGRVKMLALTYYRQFPGREKMEFVRKHPDIIIKPTKQNGIRVRLHTNKGENDHSHEICRLVAEAFIPEYKDGMDVVHKDGNVLNNRLDNLSVSWPKVYDGEIWKDVTGFEGRYQISNMGRVRSLDRYTNHPHPNFLKGKLLNPSMNKGRGYLRISLSDGSRNYKHYDVHRLVAIHFVDGFKPGLVVNHINEIKTDNRAENLEWCTYKYNLNYSDVVAWKRKPVYQYDLDGNFIAKHKCCAEAEKVMGTYQGAMVHVMYESKVGMWHGFRWSYEYRTKEQWSDILAKYKSSLKPVAQLDDDGNELARFNTMKEASKKMGVSITAISRCCKGKSIHAAGYRWRMLY